MVSSNSTVLGPVPSSEPSYQNETVDIFKEVISNGSGMEQIKSFEFSLNVVNQKVYNLMRRTSRRAS
jgi:hypothetical protein